MCQQCVDKNRNQCQPVWILYRTTTPKIKCHVCLKNHDGCSFLGEDFGISSWPTVRRTAERDAIRQKFLENKRAQKMSNSASGSLFSTGQGRTTAGKTRVTFGSEISTSDLFAHVEQALQNPNPSYSVFQQLIGETSKCLKRESAERVASLERTELLQKFKQVLERKARELSGDLFGSDEFVDEDEEDEEDDEDEEPKTKGRK